MYCNCKDKKTLTIEVNKTTFIVCAKSKGGCGKEIINDIKWENVKLDITCWKVNECLECDGSGVKLRLQHNGITNPETCKRCGGSGVEIVL